MPLIEAALTWLLGIEHPLLLAPMGSAAGGRLAAAVTHAGGPGRLTGIAVGSGDEVGGAECRRRRDDADTRFDIVRGAPWPEIYPGRALKNAFSAKWHGREDELTTRRGDVEKKYLAAPADEFSQRVVWAGESVDLVNDIPSAAEIIERIVAQAAAALRQGAAW
jgi:nitronate monooxygenase